VATFKFTRGVKDLRPLAKSFRIKVSQSISLWRGLVLDRVCAQIAACDTGEHTWESALGNSCDAFVREKVKDDTFVWSECPSVEQLSKQRPSSKTVEPKRRGRAGIGGADADTQYDPQLSLSDFGRLMCVLVDVPTCRNSPVRAGPHQGRTRRARRPRRLLGDRCGSRLQ
jgi:hypothetical protein